MFLDVTHLGEGLLVVVFELLGVNVELVLVGGERAVVLCHLGEKLLHLHRNALAAVLEGFDGKIGRCDRIWWRKKERRVCLKLPSSVNCYLMSILIRLPNLFAFYFCFFVGF